MIFFRDFAYTALVKKYHLYLEDLNKKCHKIQGCLLKFKYLQKLKRKKKMISIIQGYLKSKITSDQHNKLIKRLMTIQKAVREKLKYFRMQKKIKHMEIIQVYVKK